MDINGESEKKKKKYRKAEYKAAHIWHSRHDVSTCVALKIHMAYCSGKGQAEKRDKLGAHMAIILIFPLK